MAPPGTRKLSIDGVLDPSINLLGDSPPLTLAAAYHLGIGGRERGDHTGFEDQFPGFLYDVRIYNNALSPNRIQSIVVPPPALTIQQWTGNQVRISWPVTATGFVIEQSSAVPGGWGTSGLSVTVEGSENVAYAPALGSAQFYRLKK